MLLIRRFEERGRASSTSARRSAASCTSRSARRRRSSGRSARCAPTDYLIGTYRTHGHAMARGSEPARVMAELFGRVDGLCRGRGGSMHMFDLPRRFMGGYGIVGGNLPIAAGFGLASRLPGDDDATVCQFGDGASNQGTFGETMNLAALWNLPVVFMVDEQPLRDGHLARAPFRRDRPAAQGRGLRRPGAWSATGWTSSTRSAVTTEALRDRARGAPALLVEALHLPLPRPLRRRSRGVPRQGGGRGVAQARPDRDASATALEAEDVIERRRARSDGRDGGRDRRRGGRVRRRLAGARSPARSTTTSTCSAAQVQGWYSVDERGAGVRKGEEHPLMARCATARR